MNNTKLIDKDNLEFRQGYLVDKRTDEALHLPDLAFQVNEIVELRDLNAFIDTNRTKIAASGEDNVVAYEVPVIKRASFAPVDLPAQPLHDEEAAKRKALALEFLDTEQAKGINGQLARYGAVAGFLADDYVVVHSGEASLFKADPFELTEDDVRDAVIAFRDPENAKLRGKLEFL